MKDLSITTRAANDPAGRQHPARTTIMAIAALAVLVTGCSSDTSSTGDSAAAAQSSTRIQHAEFLDSGEVKLPENWRSWIFVGANLTPKALNGGEVLFPEFHYTYMEPTAWEHYKATGTFAEGTQMVKELVLLVEGEYEDGSVDRSPGRGYYSDKPVALALEYKDSERFPDAPGGWGYFGFGFGQPYKTSAPALTYAECAACHELAKATDYVFTENYPVMQERDGAYAPSTGR